MKMTNGKVWLTILVVLLALAVTLNAALADSTNLEIKDLSVNTIAVAKNGNTSGLKPEQTMTFSFTLKNNLTHAITGIKSTVGSDLANLVYTSSDLINLNAGQEQKVTFTITVPYTATEGPYATTLTVIGTDFNDKSTLTDNYSFNTAIVQDVADVYITGLSAQDTTIACKSSTTLTLNYTNRGKNDETDVIVTIKNGASVLSTSDKLTLKKNDKGTYSATVLASNLTSGSNVLTAEIAYRDNFLKDSKTVSVQKNSCVSSVSPTESTLTIGASATQLFKLNLAETGFTNNVQWTVNDTVVSGTDSYTFSQTKGGDYTVKAAIGGETKSWKVTVLDKPTSKALTTNIPADVTSAQLASFPSFTVENSFGKIVFSSNVDLTGIYDLDKVILVNDGMVAVDSTATPALNKPATITLKKSFTTPIIIKSSGFNSGSFTTCAAASCVVKSNGAGQLVFTVSDFSTYKAAEQQPATLTVSDVLFDSVELGKSTNVTVNVKNDGTTDAITDMVFDVSSITSKYAAKLQNVPTTLQPGESRAITFSITVPSDENGGKHSIGSLKITSKQVSKTVDVSVNTKSFLTVEEVKVNSKSSGDLVLNDINKIRVNVQNDYTKDMTDVTVKVTLLDVDGQDIEEESDSFDLSTGHNRDETLEFDLKKEKLDNDQYDVEITVEGDADDNTHHKTVETRSIKVERKNHMVVIKKTNLGANVLDCSRQTNAIVTVENQGKSNEDTIGIKVSNSALKLALEKKDLKLDKFSGSDNEYTAQFELDLETAPAGTYPLTVEVSRDGTVEDTQTLTLNVNACGLLNTASQQTQLAAVGSNLATQLQQDLQAKTQAPVAKTTVNGTFRETDSYVLLLSVLTGLVFIALLLGLSILVFRRR